MDDSDVRIDSLSIQVESNVKPAADSLKSLALAVKAFNREVTKGNGFGGLVSLANSAKTASENMADAPTKLRNLASALRELSQASKSVKFSKELISSLSDISTAAKGISANVGQRLTSLAQGLTAIRDVGDVRISSTIGSGIAAINEAVAGINVNNMSRIGRFVEELRPLQEIGNLSISGNISREIVNISNAAEVIRDVDFTPIRQLSTALGYLAMVDDVRLPHRLADDIINLGIAAMDVQDVDWSVFERMAAGLRHLEGLGQIRIPRIRPTQQREEDRQENATRDPESVIGGGITDAAERAATDVMRLRGTLQSTNDVQAFVRSRSDLDILRLRLTAARDRLQDLLNADSAELNYRAIANATEEVKRLERELATAKGTLGGFMKDMGGGFTKGAGISGAVSQLKDIFSSPGSAIGYGLGAALKFAVTQVGNLASAMKNVGVKAFTVAINGLQTALRGVASAASLAAKGIIALGSKGTKALAGIAKIEFKALTALPMTLGKGLVDKVKKVTTAITGFTRSIGRVAFYRLVRSAIKAVTQAFSEGVKNLYQWSLLVDRTFADSMDKIATSMLYLKNSLGAAVAPIINTLAPVIDAIVDKFVDGINMVNQFLAAITGSETYTAAKKLATEWAENETEKANKNLKELKKTILGFDELNILNGNKDNDSGNGDKKVADYKNMFETRNIESNISNFAKKVRAAFNNGEWAQIGSLVAEKFNGWVDSIDWTGLGTKLGQGVNNLVATYNALMDGIDWKNLGKHFGEGIVGILDTVNWNELGRAFSKKINALFGVLLGIFETPDIWTKLGKAFADGMWGFIDGIDWVTMGTAIGKGITGLANALIEFATNFPWAQAGLKIAEGANALFDNIDWVAVVTAFNTMLTGALTSILTFIAEFKWDKHAEALHQGFRKLVDDFPVDDLAKSLQESIRSLLRLALPTLKDTELFETLGKKLARFFNKLFDNSNKFWDTVGESANAFIVSLLTIGYNFVNGFDEKLAANSIKTALGKIEWANIAEYTWSTVKSALSKAGSFVDALFSKDTNGLRGKKLEEATAYNLKPLGIRMADSVKEVIGAAPWEDIAKTTWQNVKGGFKVAYDFVSAMFGLDESTAADTDKKLKKIGEQIGGELRAIPWATIASDVWANIKTAFAHAGNFLDALLHENTNGLRGKKLEEATAFNAMSFGEKLGTRISRGIAAIDWQQFGSDLGAGASNLLKTFSEALNKLTTKDKITGNSPIEQALKDFIEGINKEELGAAIKDSLRALADVIAQTFGVVLNEAFNDLFSDPGSYINGYTESTFAADPLMGAGSSSGMAGKKISGAGQMLGGAGRADLWASKGKTLAKSIVDGTVNELNASQSVLSTAFKNAFVDPYMIEVEGEKGFDVGSPSERTKDLGSWAMQGFMNGLKLDWLTVLQTVSKGVQDLITLVLQPLKNLVEIGIPGKMQIADTDFATGWNTIQQTTSSAVQNVVTLTLQPLNNLVTTGITNAMNTANSNFSTGWNTIQQTSSSGVQNVVSLILQPLNNIASIAIPTSMSSFNDGFYTGWNNINSTTSSAMYTFVNTIENAVEGLGNYLPNRFRSMFNEVVNLANGLIDRVESAINSVIGGLNNALRIELRWDRPDWAGGGTYWWDWSPNLSTVNFGNINWLAMGGILDSATWLAPNVIGGEAGREAVLPLESHTDWMNDVADRVVARANGNYWNNGVEGDGGNAQYDNSREIALIERLLEEVRAIKDKDTTVEITSSQISRSQVRQNRRAGVTVVPVGT